MVAIVERSPGTVVRVGVVPFIVGGGYHGASEELDSIVDLAAVALRDMFNHPVTIRFNSDRESGGAWLKTAEVDAIGANCEVEIGAKLWKLAALRKSFDKYMPDGDTWESFCAERLIDPAGPNEQVTVNSYIKRDYLRDPSLVNDGEGADAKSWRRHDTLAEAIEFVRAHAVADPRAVTAARKRRAAGMLAAKVRQTRLALAALSKRELTAVAWRIPYQYRPAHFGFKNPKENKGEIATVILNAVRGRDYTFDPEHTKPRW